MDVRARGEDGDLGDAPPPPTLVRQDSVQEAYVCPLTREVFLNPVTIACGHNFERDDLAEALKVSPKCPVCKANAALPSGGLNVNIVLRDTVRRMFPDALLSGEFACLFLL